MDRIDNCMLSDTQRMVLNDYRSALRNAKESMMNQITAWTTPRHRKDLYTYVALDTIMLTEKRINALRSQHAKVVRDFGTVIAGMNDTYMSYAFSYMEESGYTRYTAIDMLPNQLHYIELQALKQNILMTTVDKNTRSEKYQILKQTWRNHFLAPLPKQIREQANKIF